MVKREPEEHSLPGPSLKRANVGRPSSASSSHSSSSHQHQYQHQRPHQHQHRNGGTAAQQPRSAAVSTSAPAGSSSARAGPSSQPAAASSAASSSSSSLLLPSQDSSGDPSSSLQADEKAIKSARAKFWRSEGFMRALARATVPDVSLLLTLTRLNSVAYRAAMTVFLERVEISKGSLSGIYKLLNKKRYLAQSVRTLVVSDNWPYKEVWLSPTTTVAASFGQFWPSLTPFMQLAEVLSWVCPRRDQNVGLRIDIALDFWCTKALYEVFRAQRAAASRVRALRITGTAPVYIPPTTVKAEERAAFLHQFEGIMWASLDHIVRMSDRLELFQILPRGNNESVVAIPATVPMTLADLQPDVQSIKLTIEPAHRYALLALSRHYWNSLTSLSIAFVNADQYPYEMKEFDAMLGKKWLDLTELRISFCAGVTDVLRWSWSHPRLKVLEVEMSKAVEERVIKFVHDHPSIEHLYLHSDERCKRPSKYPPRLRSCAIVLGSTSKDPFAAAVESGAPYVTALLRGRTWKTDLDSVAWTERLGTLTALDLVMDVAQLTLVCGFFRRENAQFFTHLLELCLICDKFEMKDSKKFQGGIDFLSYALEHLRFVPRLQVVALNSFSDALDPDDVRRRLFRLAPTLRAAAWLTSAEEAQIFRVEHVPQLQSAALRPVSPFLAGFSRLDCGQEERGWPYDYSFFLHAPDGRAVPRSPLVSFPG